MRLLLSILTVGCVSITSPEPPVTSPTEPPPDDTGFPPGDLAHLEIDYDTNSERVLAYGLFVAAAPNYANLARCVIEDGGCVPTLPVDEAHPLVYDPDDTVDSDILTTRFVGDTLTLGPYVLTYRENPETGVGFYAADVSEQGPTAGWIGGSWSGQWPAYEGTDDLFVPGPIAIQTPRAGRTLTFTNDLPVPIEWVPSGDGEITLTLSRGFGDVLTYQLDDDGYFELDGAQVAALLGLTDEVADLTGLLTRWSRSTLVKFGHVVEYVSTSTVTFDAQLVQIGTRDHVQAADECPQAQGALPLEAGQYWGWLGEPQLTATSDVGGSCLDPGGSNAYAGAWGTDGIFRLVVPPRHHITVDYTLLTESGSVYLVQSCDNLDQTCVDGSDLSPDTNEHELVSAFNSGDDDQSLYLVIDASDFGDESFFTLDVSDERFDEPALYDTCAEAEAAAPTVTSGTYWGTFTAYTAGSNPGVGGCTGTSLPGADALTPVVLAPGQTLTAAVEMEGGDPALYLLFDCANLFTCPVGADQNRGSREQIAYTHLGQFPLTAYLVLDTKSTLRPFFLTVNVQ